MMPWAGSGQAGFGRWRAFRGSCFATPCGSKLAVPFRSELLRAQPVLIRRLCRLAKLGLGGGREYLIMNIE